MRKEPFTVGDYIHIYARGNRKQPIVRDAKDRWHFLQLLYYCNNKLAVANPFRDLKTLLKFNFNKRLMWPEGWPAREPIIKILAFSLVENHYHISVKEESEGGVETFMRRFGTSMAKYFNAKYGEVGGLFQGSYRAKVIEKDEYLQYLSVYIQVKNTLELYSGGLAKALQEFDKAFEWATQYPYGSLGDYASTRNSPIIDKDILGDMFPTPESYRKFAKECFLSMNFEQKLGSLTFELD